MTPKEKETLIDTINCEGFDYCFTHYSSWQEIKDKKFHELRLAYVEAREKLIEYTGVEGV